MDDVNFSVIADQSAVNALSTKRLQFEPRGEMLRFRADIRAALGSMQLAPGQHLRVEYTPSVTATDGWVDLENVTLYNVGMGHFAHLLDDGISCQRLEPSGELHRVTYSGAHDWIPPSATNQFVARLLGTLNDFPRSVTEWWRAFRLMEFEQKERLGEGEAFRLVVIVKVRDPGGWLGPRLKPMLDGLVSALHAHDGSSRENLEPRLDHALGGQNWQLLTESSRSVLPIRRLLRPHGERFAWNPADELCSGFDVRVRVGAPEVKAAVFR